MRDPRCAEPWREPIVQRVVVEAIDVDIAGNVEPDLAATTIGAVGDLVIAAEKRSISFALHKFRRALVAAVHRQAGFADIPPVNRNSLSRKRSMIP